jgi:two-component system, OmpR family, sensor histidine kinase MprB
MTFRRRVILLVAAAVATAVVLGSAATYLIVRRDLREGLENQLRGLVAGVLIKTSPIATHNSSNGLSDKQVAQIRHAISDPKGSLELRALLGPKLASAVQAAVRIPSTKSDGTSVQVTKKLVLPQTRLEFPAGYAQFVSRDGRLVDPPPAKALLPVTKETRAIAAGLRKPDFSDTTVGGLPVRVLTAPVTGGAVQAAVSASAVDHTLDRLALTLVLVSIGGVGFAAALAVLVSRAALKPVAELTATTERVSRTQDLSERLSVDGRDELARLAMSFNRMLAALEASSGAQRQLVADASHELRTPLASVLMNIELLGENGRLPSDERERVIADLTEQIHELTVLVGDLIDLARDEPTDAEATDVRLDEIVGEAIVRAERHARGQRFTLDSEPTPVVGVGQRLERAVNNLLDNALKWNAPGQAIEVTVRGGEVSVRDHGPGFREIDLPHVFDRFYRAAGSRGLPGAGLGLAIVRQVAEAHGGTIEAANAPGGGALLRMRLPVARALPESLPLS